MRRVILAVCCGIPPLCIGASPAPATLVVVNVNDSGVGSFRQAILDSNASVGVLDTIEFNIPGGGLQSIALASALPDITDPVWINGQTQPGYNNVNPIVELNGAAVASPDAVLTISAGSCEVYALAINRGPDAGIRIRTNGNNLIGDCSIGTNPEGTLALGNGTHGIIIENVPNNRISAPILGRRNVIGGNVQHGVLITGASATGNVVYDNLIGTDWGMTAAVGNGGFGVLVVDGSNSQIDWNQVRHNAAGGVRIQGSAVGASIQSNQISHNSGAGISILAPAAGVTIQSNGIFSNAGLGVDLEGDGRTPNDTGDADGGANARQNFPVLTGMVFLGGGAPRVANLTGRLESTPSSTFTIQVFLGNPGTSANDAQAMTGLSGFTVTTDASGLAEFVAYITLQDGFSRISATATDGAGNTSELSVAFNVPDLVAKSGCGLSGLEALLLPLLLALRRRRR